ncbi:atypical dual specificity phosphatase [Methylococcales bacterium]|nr:atypical dual specificity phosphatase [Methylococcales bacterium]
MLFREVVLGQGLKGKLFLHGMPGRYEALADSLQEIQMLSIIGILSLASLEEIERKSPTYAAAIKSNQLSCEYMSFPIVDYGVPEERRELTILVKDVAERLRSGERLLMHCGAGIGRTGTVACCILIELGLSRANAEKSVARAGSHPETASQNELINWYAQARMVGGAEK